MNYELKWDCAKIENMLKIYQSAGVRQRNNLARVLYPYFCMIVRTTIYEKKMTSIIREYGSMQNAVDVGVTHLFLAVEKFDVTRPNASYNYFKMAATNFLYTQNSKSFKKENVETDISDHDFYLAEVECEENENGAKLDDVIFSAIKDLNKRKMIGNNTRAAVEMLEYLKNMPYSQRYIYTRKKQLSRHLIEVFPNYNRTARSLMWKAMIKSRR